MSDESPASPTVLSPLPDEAIVVRGGLMAAADLDVSAETHHGKHLEGKSDVPWAHSVFSHTSNDSAAICRDAWPMLQHPQIRVSTVGALREAGYDVVLTNVKNGHSLIPVEPGPPWDWTALTKNFLDPQPNPEKQRRKKKEAKQ